MIEQASSGLAFSRAIITFWHRIRRRFLLRGRWQVLRTYEQYYKNELQNEARSSFITHRTRFTGFERQEAEAIDNMLSGAPVLVFSAPPGSGKSRFAIALAERLQKHETLWNCLFVEHDLNRATDAIGSLSKFKRCVLVIDDAHRSPQLVDRLAKLARESSGKHRIHLVCLCRSSMLHMIESVAGLNFVSKSLPTLTRDQLVAIVHSVIPNAPEQASRAIASYAGRLPFLAVALALSAKRNSSLFADVEPKVLRAQLCRTPVEELSRDDFIYEQAVTTLAVIAAYAPVPESDKRVIEQASEISGIDEDGVKVLLRRAVEAGLFERFGRGKIRPTPDLVGDLLLDEACFHKDGSTTGVAERLREMHLSEYKTNIVSNLADLGFSNERKNAPDVVGNLIEAKIRELTAYG